MKYASLAFWSILSIGASASANGALKLGFDIKRGDSAKNAVRNAAPKSKATNQTNYVQTAVSNDKTFYALNVSIGSRHDNVEVILDTGSSDLWVVSQNVKCLSVPEEESDDDEEEYYDIPYRKRAGTPTLSIPELTDIPTGIFTESISIDTSLSEYFDTYNPFDQDYSTYFGSSSVPEATCTQYGSYNTGKSDTFKRNNTAPPFLVQYGDDTAAYGVWGTDDVTFGGYDIKNLTLGIANESSSAEGVFGIGLESLESSFLPLLNNSKYSVQYPNLPSKLKSEGLIKKKLYSLYLGGRDATNGTVLFGAVDHAKYSGQLSTVPLVVPNGAIYNKPQGFYIVTDSLSFHSRKVNRTLGNYTFPALLDSGSTLSLLPIDLYKRVANYLGGIYDEVSGNYLVPCTIDNSTYFEFNFSGAKIRVPLTNLLYKTNPNSRDSWTNGCILGLGPSLDGTAVLGDNFLRSAYVVYDLEDYQISLAQVKYTNKEDIQVISNSISGASKAPEYTNTKLNTTAVVTVLDTFATYPTHSLTGSNLYLTTSRNSSNSSSWKPNGKFFNDKKSSAGTFSMSIMTVAAMVLLSLVIVM